MQVDVKLELEDAPLTAVLVFDRKAEVHVFPWQDAMRLGQTMLQAHRDWLPEFRETYPITDVGTMQREACRVRAGYLKGNVSLCTRHVDRVRFSMIDAWQITAQHVMARAKDAELETLNGIRFVYCKGGILLKRVLNRNYPTQIVRE